MKTTSRRPTTARSDHSGLAGYERSVGPLDVVVKELRADLGAPLVAYIAGVKETRAVHEWAEGVRDVRGVAREQRLRVALRVAALIAEHDRPATIQAWFQGLNPKLNDFSPARLLREAADVEEAGRAILDAARAFVSVGRGRPLPPSLRLRVVPGEVFRVGYAPAPWDWTPWAFAPFPRRWDDPEPGGYRVLYSGSSPFACFVEALAQLRPDPAVVTDIAALTIDPGTLTFRRPRRAQFLSRGRRRVDWVVLICRAPTLMFNTPTPSRR